MIICFLKNNRKHLSVLGIDALGPFSCGLGYASNIPKKAERKGTKDGLKE